MRAVRRVPAPPERFRRGGRARSDPLPGDGGCHAMSYAVKEIYYTLQGEGANVGRPAVFLRFSGCNLWSGREQDRAAATCGFCDTDFVGTDGPGGGRFASARALARAVSASWPDATPVRFETLPFAHFFLQPMDGPERARNTELAVRYCLAHPQWRLSLQTHKLLGIP